MGSRDWRRSPYTCQVEFIPKALIAGVFVQSQIVSTGPVNLVMPTAGNPVTRDTINGLWSEVVKEYPYQSLQFDPTGTGALFLGSGPDDVVIIQPPLVQVREPIGISVEQSARKVADVFKLAAHRLSATIPQNLGVKLVYHAPAPGGSAVDFVLSELVAGQDDVRNLAGAMKYEASVKYTLRSDSVTYTLGIEPLHIDPQFLFLDLDAQFPGSVDVAGVRNRVLEVEGFAHSQVRSFLERRAEGWSR